MENFTTLSGAKVPRFSKEMMKMLKQYESPVESVLKWNDNKRKIKREEEERIQAEKAKEAERLFLQKRER